MSKCYDFPEVVIHDPDCPRYHGGRCRPNPTPTPPYTEAEQKAVTSYLQVQPAMVKFIESDGKELPAVKDMKLTRLNGRFRENLTPGRDDA